MNDWRGTPIEVGSTIIWAVTHGSHMVMVEGEVIKIVDAEPEYEGSSRMRPVIYAERKLQHRGPVKIQRMVKLTALQRIVVMP